MGSRIRLFNDNVPRTHSRMCAVLQDLLETSGINPYKFNGKGIGRIIEHLEQSGYEVNMMGIVDYIDLEFTVQ